MLLKIRHIQKDLTELHAKDRGRLIAITGPRQSGKSTLAQMAFPEYPIINLDSPVEREMYERMTPADWIARFPNAILDEIQKLPRLIETVKACYDRDQSVKYILLGSSQILLLRQVAETLAGRVAIRELFPFSLPELCVKNSDSAPSQSRLLRILTSDVPVDAIRGLAQGTGIDRQIATVGVGWEYYLKWGGMPALLKENWTDTDRFEWLQDYHATYLQRDLADLAKLNQLEPFVRAQKAAAMRTACTINFSEIARLSDIAPSTAKQFLRYLEVSYQVILLPAWFRNREKRLSKQPKLHFMDPGINRAILRKQGATTGPEFESAVVGEIVKQCRTDRLPVEFFHLRTADGREVDFIIEREDGFIAIECKLAGRIERTDFRHFRDLDTILDKPLLAACVVSNDPLWKPCNDNPSFWNVPAAGLLT